MEFQKSYSIAIFYCNNAHFFTYVPTLTLNNSSAFQKKSFTLNYNKIKAAESANHEEKILVLNDVCKT